MNNPKDFPFPLDTDVEEQVPVQKLGVEMSPDGKPIVKRRTVLETQTVRYMNVPKSKHRCKDGEHVFTPLFPSRWIFGCTLCQYSRKVFPGRHKLVDGKLIDRRTNRAI